ncbi:hypothetical protein Dimus_025966 [Dionaea muscipula]
MFQNPINRSRIRPWPLASPASAASFEFYLNLAHCPTAPPLRFPPPSPRRRHRQAVGKMSFNSSRPASSNSIISKSKRSRNSNSSTSNPSNVSGSSSRKRKSNQKTLGVAWGANSLSSSRSSFRRAPFSGFGSYMAEKNRKLHSQFDAEASTSSHGGSDSGKPIFEGVSIFVNGFTIPSSQELRKYMLNHGGRFENYFSRRRVTHIICSNLPDGKIKNLRSFSGGLPVVKPAWVQDSVSANRLLSWVPYQLDQLASDAHSQLKLSSFFALENTPKLEDASTVSSSILRSEPEDSESRGMFNDQASFAVDESPECSGQYGGKIRDPLNKDIHAEKDDRDVSDEEMPQKGIGKSSSNDAVNSVAENGPNSGLHQPLALTRKDYPDRKSIGESSGSLIAETSHHRHSTSEDPNFVENYFKSLRLHFIGTWRNRYRKCFGILSHGSQQTSSGANISAPFQKTAIIHVDMDSFFVSVVVRNHPELQDKPVAVCHSDNSKGTAEISSANYRARDYGVKAGMFVRNAKALCPDLVIVPYNFEAYEEVADQFYNILHKHSKKVQAVSCDEAFLDVTDSEEQDPEILACTIRKEIFDATGCTASAGIAENMLMARLATRSAKPDGQCHIPSEKVDEYLLNLPIKALPGIGHALEDKLNKRHVQTCGQLRMISKDSLQKDFGLKTGEMLWNYCRGVDNRFVGIVQESKSLGAEVNWGVRFKDLIDAHRFLLSLCKEVSLRLLGCGVQGRTFTLKIKKRRKDAGEPVKYMGCGDCENLSHSMTIPVPTDDVDVLQRITIQLFGFFHIDVKDIRGVGLQVSKLENAADCSKQGHERNTLRSWIASASRGSHNLSEGVTKDGGSSCSKSGGLPSMMTQDPGPREAWLNLHSELPALDDLDISVLENLPLDLLSEMNEMYGRKLIDFISGKKGRTDDSIDLMCPALQHFVEGHTMKAEEPGADYGDQMDEVDEKNEGGCRNYEGILADSAVGIGSNVSASGMDNCDLMPSSLSQVDVSVFEQLPKELREDIVVSLPTHRAINCRSDSVKDSVEQLAVGTVLDHSRVLEPDSYENLWVGNPPCWIDKFKGSNCLMLKILAEMYFRSGCTGQLSSILQCFISKSKLRLVEADDDAVSSLCKLVMQYIQLKLDVDLEEIYVCIRLLKRFTRTSEVFQQLYHIVLSYVQTCIGDKYGGSLNISPLRQ